MKFPRGNPTKLYTPDGVRIIRALDIRDSLVKQGIKLRRIKGRRTITLPSGESFRIRVTVFHGQYRLRLLCPRCGAAVGALYAIEPDVWVCDKYSRHLFDPTVGLGLDIGNEKDIKRYHTARSKRLRKLKKHYPSS